MLSTDILLFNVRKIPTENLIDMAMDAGWKVIDELRKVVFIKESERVSIYFSDDDKSQFLRAYL